MNNKKNILSEIIKIAKVFAIESKLLTNQKMIKLIKKIEKNNGHATMAMLGNVVLSDIYFKGARRVEIMEKKVELL